LIPLPTTRTRKASILPSSAVPAGDSRRLSCQHDRLVIAGFERHQPAYRAEPSGLQRGGQVGPGQSAIAANVMLEAPAISCLVRDVDVHPIVAHIRPLPDLPHDAAPTFLSEQPGWPGFRSSRERVVVVAHAGQEQAIRPELGRDRPDRLREVVVREQMRQSVVGREHDVESTGNQLIERAHVGDDEAHVETAPPGFLPGACDCPGAEVAAGDPVAQGRQT
jgi:hypothetical protein